MKRRIVLPSAATVAPIKSPAALAPAAIEFSLTKVPPPNKFQMMPRPLLVEMTALIDYRWTADGRKGWNLVTWKAHQLSSPFRLVSSILHCRWMLRQLTETSRPTANWAVSFLISAFPLLCETFLSLPFFRLNLFSASGQRLKENHRHSSWQKQSAPSTAVAWNPMTTAHRQPTTTTTVVCTPSAKKTSFYGHFFFQMNFSHHFDRNLMMASTVSFDAF